MPQVPYQPVPQVDPSGEGIRGVQVGVQPEAFGVGIGQAIGHVGKVVEGAGDEIFRRAIEFQELQNQTEARQAQTQFELESTALRADFHSKQGNAAGPEALKQYQENLTGLRQKILGGMSNPDSRRRFDSESSGFLAREVFAGAGHSGQQVKVAANASIDAQLATSIKTMSADPSDDGRYNNWKDQVRDLANQKAQLLGRDQSVADELYGRVISEGLMHRVTEMAKRDPDKAMQMLEANRADMRPDQLEKAEDVVRLQNRTQSAKLYAYGVALKGDPETWQSLEKLKEDARKAAIKQDPGDKMLPSFYEHEVENKYWVHKREVADQQQKTRLVLQGGLIGNASPDGKLPTTPEELTRLSPQLEEAWINSNEATQKWVRDGLANNAKKEYAQSPETEARVRELLGMKRERPVDFLNVNLAAERLPVSDRRMLFREQEKVHVKADQDPRVNRAIRLLNADMLNLGIMKNQDPVRYERFVGGVQQEMARYQSENAKEMPQDEIYKMGARLLQDVKDPEKWFGRTSKMFELTLPSTLAQEMKEDYRKKYGFDPSDEQVRRAFIARRYKELYGGGTE